MKHAMVIYICIHIILSFSEDTALAEARRVKLPLRMDLEINPLTMKAWNYVQSLAHNPRLR